MKTVKVVFENKEYNYVTSVNPLSTEWELCSYFIGTSFNVAPFPAEQAEKCIEILIDGVLYRPLRNLDDPKKLLRQVRDALNKNKSVEKLIKIAQILGVK